MGGISGASGADMNRTTKSFWQSTGYIPLALHTLAISLLGYAVSGSTVAAGWLGTASMIAQQVASVFGGTFVDGHDRKRPIVTSAVLVMCSRSIRDIPKAAQWEHTMLR